jgi:endoglucanase Acf2
VTLSGPTAPTVSARSGYYALDINGHNYVSSAGSGVSVTATGSSVTYTASGDGLVTIGVLPTGLTDTAGFIAEMQDPLTGTEVGYGAGTSTVTTTFMLKTRNNDGSMMAIMPTHQNGTPPSGLLGTYATVIGTLKLYKFSNYTFTTNAPPPPTRLDIAKITATEKTEIVSALTTDINNLSSTGFSADDTYFGGKQLARAANLMDLARQLGQTTLAQQAYDKLNAQMVLWLNPDGSGRATRYFYYDTNLKGIVGVRASFGSDTEFNDHHFHYGYFIYAAGLMAHFHPEFATTHKNVITALIRDIANTNRSDQYFPYLRPFDQYAGHAWASGTSPFVDGNNNESSSEAVNAWYGLYLWAKSSNDPSLETLARWLYGRESDAALAYWTNFDRSQPQFVNYKPSVVSMVWGGKMDYGTWFSPSSYAKLGIQILPVTPGSVYLGRDSTRVATNLTNLNDGSAAMFTDIMTMYKSYSNPTGAATEARALPGTALDDGNSRAWLLAWVYSHQ